MIGDVSALSFVLFAAISYIGVLWLALAFSVIRDARRRAMSQMMWAVSMGLAFFPPFLGALVYFVVRPPQTMEEERALELELYDPAADGEAPNRACPHCGREIERAFIICPYCRTQFARRCGNCDRAMRLGWSICPYCATEVVASAQMRRPPVPR